MCWHVHKNISEKQQQKALLWGENRAARINVDDR